MDGGSGLFRESYAVVIPSLVRTHPIPLAALPLSLQENQVAPPSADTRWPYVYRWIDGLRPTSALGDTRAADHGAG